MDNLKRPNFESNRFTIKFFLPGLFPSGNVIDVISLMFRRVHNSTSNEMRLIVTLGRLLI